MIYHFEVILASYNGERFIEEQLLSILNQRNSVLNISVFDDGSTDKTCSIVEAMSDVYKNISLFRRDVNTGSAANNFLIGLGQVLRTVEKDEYFIAFSDQDDIWVEDKLERAIIKSLSSPWDLYCSNLQMVHSGKRIGILRKDYPQRRHDFLFEGGSAGCTYIFQKRLGLAVDRTFRRINVDDWQSFSHDWFVYFVARYGAFKVFIDKFSSVNYRIHDTNVHGSLSTGSFNALLGKYKLLREGWFENHALNYSRLIDEGRVELELYNSYLHSSRWRAFITFLFYRFRLRSTKRTILFYFHLLLREIR